MRIVALGLVASLSVCSPPGAPAAEEKSDIGNLRIRRAIAERLTPEQLGARQEALGRRIATRRAALRAPGVGETPADTCPLATAEIAAPPHVQAAMGVPSAQTDERPPVARKSRTEADGRSAEECSAQRAARAGTV